MSKVQSNFEAQLEVVLYECGHGETLLVCIGNKYWILIDCHLPDRDAKLRFFAYLEQRGVSRIDLVLLTHAHYDHYFGLADVLEHFSSDDRTVGIFCDSGIEPAQMYDLLRASGRLASEGGEYARLQRVIDQLEASGKVRYKRVDENHEPILFGDNAVMQFIAPDPALLRRLTRRVAWNKRAPNNILNLTSIVVILELRSLDQTCYCMLTGDSGRRGLEKAYKLWRSRDKGTAIASVQIFKVPHHGSFKSHSEGLCGSIINSDTAALVSVGSRFRALPDRRVLTALLDRGATTLLTTKRLSAPQAHSVLETLAAKQSLAYSRQTVILKWLPRGGLKWQPTDAALARSEIELYS